MTEIYLFNLQQCNGGKRPRVFLVVAESFLLSHCVGSRLNLGTSLETSGSGGVHSSRRADRLFRRHRDCSVRKQAATAGAGVLSASVALHSLSSSRIYKDCFNSLVL